MNLANPPGCPIIQGSVRTTSHRTHRAMNGKNLLHRRLSLILAAATYSLSGPLHRDELEVEYVELFSLHRPANNSNH